MGLLGVTTTRPGVAGVLHLSLPMVYFLLPALLPNPHSLAQLLIQQVVGSLLLPSSSIQMRSLVKIGFDS
jgi:hypothetical protein